MAKYTPMDLIKSMSGKLCGHSDISFAKRGDTLYTQKRCNERSTPFSEAELARQQMFADARAAVKALTAEQVAEYTAAFKAQKKYSTLQGYMFAMEYAKLANA